MFLPIPSDALHFHVLSRLFSDIEFHLAELPFRRINREDRSIFYSIFTTCDLVIDCSGFLSFGCGWLDSFILIHSGSRYDFLLWFLSILSLSLCFENTGATHFQFSQPHIFNLIFHRRLKIKRRSKDMNAHNILKCTK